MIAAYILLIAAAALFAVWLGAAKGRSLSLGRTTPREILPVDLAAFRNLMDPCEEEYLRQSLSPATFRAVQRRRLLAAVDYITCVKNNASALLTIGETARLSSDPQVAVAGQQLVECARIFALDRKHRIGRTEHHGLFHRRDVEVMHIAFGVE